MILMALLLVGVLISSFGTTFDADQILATNVVLVSE
jgi:hypothetical protein